MSMNASLHLNFNKESISMSPHGTLKIGAGTDYVEIYASPDQLQQIADVINGYLVCQKELLANENQLQLNYELNTAWEGVA